MILNTYNAMNLAELRTAIDSLEEFAWIASKCKTNAHELNLECANDAGVQLILRQSVLSDGSKVYDVEFKTLDTRVPQAVYADTLTGRTK